MLEPAPPLPPQCMQTQDNPVYVKVELTDCIAYERGPDRPSLHHLPTTHLSEDMQQKEQRDIVGVGSVITESKI